MTVAAPAPRASEPGATSRLEVLVDYQPAGRVRSGTLEPALRQLFGSDISIPLRRDRPAVIANFVSTIDGVVSYNTPEAAGGGEISGFSTADRFVMGLLRSLSDAVLIGAGTLRAAPNETWACGFTYPPTASDLKALRRRLGLTAEPTTVVVTASGNVDLSHKGLADPSVPALIVTTERGRIALQRQHPVPGHIDAVAAGSSDRVDPRDLLDLLGERGLSVVLCEGGPQLFGQLLAARLVDELFLTVAPQVAGRSPDTPRLSLVEGTAFGLADAPWSRLAELRRSGNHLFTRYTFEEAAP